MKFHIKSVNPVIFFLAFIILEEPLATSGSSIIVPPKLGKTCVLSTSFLTFFKCLENPFKHSPFKTIKCYEKSHVDYAYFILEFAGHLNTLAKSDVMKHNDEVKNFLKRLIMTVQKFGKDVKYTYNPEKVTTDSKHFEEDFKLIEKELDVYLLQLQQINEKDVKEIKENMKTVCEEVLKESIKFKALFEGCFRTYKEPLYNI